MSLLPVLAFLAALELIDAYKLLKFRRVLQTVAAGWVAALACLALNSVVFAAGVPSESWARFGAPVLEETAKALCVVLLIRAGRIAFMVDAAISGFAVGAGFAVVENIVYLAGSAAPDATTAAVRGLGTALMHSGTAAIFGLAAVNRIEFSKSLQYTAFIPGFAVAIAIHMLYNQFLLPPVASAAALLVVLPSVLSFGFWRGEKRMGKWLGAKLDRDMELLGMISTGVFDKSPAGAYLRSLESAFGPLVLGDMLCYLQVSVELSAQAKGALLRREMGFPEAPDPELPARLKELKYLERQIGRAGKYALAPLLGSSHRDEWEIHQLTDGAGPGQTA
ncbi:MAG TPA: PrsW family glutamic-type intramembrane protease [Bryobacteraceae bacterium]